MFKNYFKIIWRNLAKNKLYSVINITGLALGMAVVILIGLWINDELSFNRSLKNYERIVQAMYHSDNISDETSTVPYVSVPIAIELRNKYHHLFKHVSLARNTSHVFAINENKISYKGLYAEKPMTDILALPMIKGDARSMADPSSILISENMANALFGDEDALGKNVRIDNKTTVKITGVYKDLAANTTFAGVDFIQPWAYWENDRPWVKTAREQWNNNSFFAYAELNDGVYPAGASEAVKDLLRGKPDRTDKETVFLHPMSKWHLYSEFKNGENTGGTIQFVWMFGIIGAFVLLLACINFMNMSTARSQKRAKEVGIRKSLGSERKQLIWQFMSESGFVALISALIGIALVWVAMPWFNTLAAKDMHIPFGNAFFWILLMGFTLLTGLIAGSYPALYLSSFSPVSILKGTFRAGRQATLPRKVLVVIQFTVSVSLIIGTAVVFSQIQHAKNRPIGYDRKGLLTVYMKTPDLYGKYDVLRTELINSGAVINMAEASNPATDMAAHLIGFDWKGKDPNVNQEFAVSWVTHDFGQTVGWKFIDGRDFSREFKTDTSGIILNQAAVKHTGFRNPVGETIKFNGDSYTIVGVIQNPVMESPYEQPGPSLFLMDYDNVGVITMKINPEISLSQALPKIEAILKKHDPATPFEYSFVDDDFAKKFASEERVGSLASFFALFSVLISCLGIFGLASFMAEQRIKEIGVRKVLGASVFNLWRLLSSDFVLLVAIAFLIAIPISWYFMEGWLQNYEYRTSISFWIFLFSAGSTLLITLVTVSFQAIKAALANPAKSLRTE